MRTSALAIILFVVAGIGLVLAAFGVGNDDFNLAYLSLALVAFGLAASVDRGRIG